MIIDGSPRWMLMADGELLGQTPLRLQGAARRADHPGMRRALEPSAPS